jgi:hypothetical protein
MWEKARNMYGAFFTELSDAMAQMPAGEFDKWCFKSVGVSLSIAIKASEVLKATDQARVQSELKAAVRVAKEARKQEVLELKSQHAKTELEKAETDLEAGQARAKLRELEAAGSGVTLTPVSAQAEAILAKLSTRRSSTRIENGLDYIRLQQLVKSGAEGIDRATGKKWKWEKWATLAIGRPIDTIRDSMQQARLWLKKTGNNFPVSEAAQIEDLTDGAVRLRIVHAIGSSG